MSSKNLRYKFDTDEDDRKLLSSHSSSYSLKNVLRDRQYKKKLDFHTSQSLKENSLQINITVKSLILHASF